MSEAKGVEPKGLMSEMAGKKHQELWIYRWATRTKWFCISLEAGILDVTGGDLEAQKLLVLN